VPVVYPWSTTAEGERESVVRGPGKWHLGQHGEGFRSRVIPGGYGNLDALGSYTCGNRDQDSRLEQLSRLAV
jgi:hypothetical protein